MKKEPKFIRCTKCKHKLKINYNQESWGLDYILICDICKYGIGLGYDSKPEMSVIKEDYRHVMKGINDEEKIIFKEETTWNRE